MIRKQRAAVDQKVRELSSAHVTYPGLKRFAGEARGPGGTHLDAFSPDQALGLIAGLKEAGWTPRALACTRGATGCDGTPTKENRQISSSDR